MDASFNLSMLLDFGQTNIQMVFYLKQGKDILRFLYLIKDSSTRHLLVVHVRDHSLVAHVSIEASFSDISGSSEANDKWLCLASSSSSSKMTLYKILIFIAIWRKMVE